MNENETLTPSQQTATLKQAEAILDGLSNEQLTKASQLASVVVQSTMLDQGAVATPVNATDWLELYTTHVWAYVAVYAVANTVARLPIKLFKRNRQTGEQEEVTAHRVLDLLEHPNSNMSGYDLKEALTVHLELVGNAYWELVHKRVTVNAVTENGKKPALRVREPVEIYPIRPDRLSPTPRKDGRGIEKWVFQTKKSARKTDLRPEQVAKFEYFNPIKDWHGLGALMPAKTEIMQDLHMKRWNKNFFEEGVLPQGVISTDQVLSRFDSEEIAKQLKEFLVGKGRKVILLSRNLKWEQVSVNPKDLDFLKGLDKNMYSILASLGVPPVMAGQLEHAKYDNYALQLESFNKLTVLPKLKKIESALRNNFLIHFADLVATETEEHLLLFDTTDLLKEDEDRLTERMKIQIRHGLRTPNEARMSLGLEKYPETMLGGDSFYMEKNLVVVGAVEPTEVDMEKAEDDLHQRVDEMQAALREAIGTMKNQIRDELIDEFS